MVSLECHNFFFIWRRPENHFRRPIHQICPLSFPLKKDFAATKYSHKSIYYLFAFFCNTLLADHCIMDVSYFPSKFWYRSKILQDFPCLNQWDNFPFWACICDPRWCTRWQCFHFLSFWFSLHYSCSGYENTTIPNSRKLLWFKEGDHHFY